MGNDANRAVRVLHLTGTLNRGGIESWLMNVFRHTDRREVAMDVVVVSPHPERGEYEDEIRALGGRIFHLPSTNRLLPFTLAFLKTLKTHGPYDIVHSHIHHFGGWALWLARMAGVPGRLATSHSNTQSGDSQARNARYAYLTLMRIAMQHSVTHRTAVSRDAARALFGPDWQALNTRLFMLGIDLENLQKPRDPHLIRAALNLPAHVPVLGHVGLLRPEKNHLFLLDVFQAYRGRYGQAELLLVGEGAERTAIEAHATSLGIRDHVHLLGSRSDVPDLLHAMDVFVFPSHFEGLSLALLEAHAVGLPCVTSTGIPLQEAGLELVRVQQIPLSDGPDRWADAVARALSVGRQASPQLPFDIRLRVRSLVELYQEIRAGND